MTPPGTPRSVADSWSGSSGSAAEPGVTLQVLPFSAGLPPVTAGSFAVLDSPASGAADVVYLENKTRIFFVDAEAEVHRYTRAFDLISELALDPSASVALLERELDGAGLRPGMPGPPSSSTSQ